MTKTVAIYGGGVAGLSVAHELSKRPGFRVRVFEATSGFGGKARSQFLKDTGSGGRRDLPGEHGFRFYPAFYRHLDETLGSIPFGNGSVLDNLVGSEELAIASHQAFSPAKRRVQAPVSLRDALALLRVWFSKDSYGLSIADAAALAASVIQVLTTSEARRQGEHDELSWYDFSGADQLSSGYQRFTATMPRTMVAMDGKKGSAYTIGKVGSQLFFLEDGQDVDRVMNGPTDERWLEPWRQHLHAKGVDFQTGQVLTKLHLTPGTQAIAQAEFENGKTASADYHVCCLPLEKLLPLIDAPLAAASPSLARVKKHLSAATEWMVGAQYFLKRRVDTVFGHVVYPDSEWALTSISQGAFWKRGGTQIEAHYGDGSVKDILSVDVSDWTKPSRVTGRSAKQHTRQEILDEVLRQLMAGLNHPGDVRLKPSDVLRSHLDTNLKFGANSLPTINTTELLVHPPGSWKHRPSVQVELNNFFLAADYVATYTNLATMEGANEAAKRAVGAILALEGRDDHPVVQDLKEPKVFEPFRRIDDWLYRNGQAHVLAGSAPLIRQALSALSLAPQVLLDLIRPATEEAAPASDPELPGADPFHDLEQALTELIDA